MLLMCSCNTSHTWHNVHMHKQQSAKKPINKCIYFFIECVGTTLIVQGAYVCVYWFLILYCVEKQSSSGFDLRSVSVCITIPGFWPIFMAAFSPSNNARDCGESVSLICLWNSFPEQWWLRPFSFNHLGFLMGKLVGQKTWKPQSSMRAAFLLD